MGGDIEPANRSMRGLGAYNLHLELFVPMLYSVQEIPCQEDVDVGEVVKCNDYCFFHFVWIVSFKNQRIGRSLIFEETNFLLRKKCRPPNGVCSKINGCLCDCCSLVKCVEIDSNDQRKLSSIL